MEWLLAHSEDADIDAPLDAIAAPAQQSAAVKTVVEYNQPAHVDFLTNATSMGFDSTLAKRALARHVCILFIFIFIYLLFIFNLSWLIDVCVFHSSERRC